MEACSTRRRRRRRGFRLHGLIIAALSGGRCTRRFVSPRLAPRLDGDGKSLLTYSSFSSTPSTFSLFVPHLFSLRVRNLDNNFNRSSKRNVLNPFVRWICCCIFDIVLCRMENIMQSIDWKLRELWELIFEKWRLIIHGSLGYNSLLIEFS